jgi:hypothetical protein
MFARNLRGGNAWISHAGFIEIDAQEFHPTVLFLARKRVDSGLPQRSPTLFIFAMRASFGIEKPHHHAVVTEYAFCGALPGYLHVEIGRKVPGESFAEVMRDGEQYSILRGCYVSPWARSVLTDHVIDGLILDTTRHVLRQDVTSIIMPGYGNAGIPLRFAFGVAETIELYERHDTALANLFGIQLAQ